MTTLSKPKQLLSALVALIMAVAMTVVPVTTASAAVNDNSGSITINNTVSGESYAVYQIAVLESYDTESGNYAYKAADAWSNWLSSDDCTWVTVTNGYVTWNEGADVSTFVAAALAYAQANDITVTDSTTASGTSVTFSGLNLGWYLVDSSLGALCSLDTTDTTMTVNDKNDEPSITKQVQEDSTGEYGDSATIDVTDTINYQLTVTVGTGVDGDYTITDVLPSGITYTANSVKVSIDAWTEGIDYTVSWSSETNALTITLDDEALADLTTSTVTITYSASIPENTVLNPNQNYTNTVTLSYKNQTYTDEATVKTYSFGGENGGFTKVDGSDGETALAGVEFVLSKTTDEGTVYATFDESGYLTGWVDSQSAATELVTDSSGHIYASGLDADTYILTETETLAGYNLLADTITVVIAENGTVTYKYTSSDDAAGSTITVENNSGSELPSTGGMGTTVIYIVGALLVIGAGVALVVRLRNRHEC